MTLRRNSASSILFPISVAAPNPSSTGPDATRTRTNALHGEEAREGVPHDTRKLHHQEVERQGPSYRLPYPSPAIEGYSAISGPPTPEPVSIAPTTNPATGPTNLGTDAGVQRSAAGTVRARITTAMPVRSTAGPRRVQDEHADRHAQQTGRGHRQSLPRVQVAPGLPDDQQEEEQGGRVDGDHHGLRVQYQEENGGRGDPYAESHRAQNGGAREHGHCQDGQLGYTG